MKKNKSKKKDNKSSKNIFITLCFLFFIIFFISTTSAFNIFSLDDWKKVIAGGGISKKVYDDNTNIVTITNQTTGQLIAKIQLLTPLNHQVIDRGENIFQQVALLELIEFDKNYKDGFKKVKIYDLKDDFKEINREIKLKYRITTSKKDESVYKKECINTGTYDINGTEIIECNYIIDYYEKIDIYEWVEFTDISELPNKKNLQIGIYADVLPGEKIEWIPDTWFGEKIDEYATWTESMNIGLVNYWNFETNVSGTYEDVVKGTTNISSFANYSDLRIGKIGNCAYIGGDFTLYNVTSISPELGSGNVNITIAFWINQTNSDANWFKIGKLNAPQVGQSVAIKNELASYFHPNNDLYFSPIGENNWTLIVVRSENVNTTATNFSVWVNGTYLISKYNVNPDFNFSFLKIGSIDGFPGSNLTGEIDELGIWNRSLTESEISDLFNNGAGLTYVSDELAPNLSLVYPQNTSYNFVQTTLNYTVNDSNLDSCWYSLDGGETNTSITCGNNVTGLNSGQGNHNWTI